MLTLYDVLYVFVVVEFIFSIENRKFGGLVGWYLNLHIYTQVRPAPNIESYIVQFIEIDYNGSNYFLSTPMQQLQVIAANYVFLYFYSHLKIYFNVGVVSSPEFTSFLGLSFKLKRKHG